MPDGSRFSERVPDTTQQFLAFLRRWNHHITFFVVGDVARQYPTLIQNILEQGHEVACHSDTHIPLTEMTPDEFRFDIDRNLRSLRSAGAEHITGFRAPVFSLTESTAWAYEVLGEFDFHYSSSVLPARNPLHGWQSFGHAPRMMGRILELPITISPWRFLNVPCAGGVYLRALPLPILTTIFRAFARRNQDVLGYMHPYDIDCNQERFMHPGINNSRAYNFLMYYNRSSVLAKLNRLFSLPFSVIRYDEYAATRKRRLSEGRVEAA